MAPKRKSESGGRMSKSLAEGVHEQPEPGVETHKPVAVLIDGVVEPLPVVANDPNTPFVSIGSRVLYVLDDGPGCGQARPATVVHLHNSTGLVNLQVLTDSTNNRHGLPVGNDLLPPLMWKTSVSYNADKALGTWHWSE